MPTPVMLQGLSGCVESSTRPLAGSVVGLEEAECVALRAVDQARDVEVGDVPGGIVGRGGWGEGGDLHRYGAAYPKARARVGRGLLRQRPTRLKPH